MPNYQRRVRTGRRVICHKHGPHDGKRGRVVDVFANGEVATVNFGSSQLTAAVDYFEPVNNE